MIQFLNSASLGPLGSNQTAALVVPAAAESIAVATASAVATSGTALAVVALAAAIAAAAAAVTAARAVATMAAMTVGETIAAATITNKANKQLHLLQRDEITAEIKKRKKRKLHSNEAA